MLRSAAAVAEISGNFFKIFVVSKNFGIESENHNKERSNKKLD